MSAGLGATGNVTLLMAVGMGTATLEHCWKMSANVKPCLARDQVHTQWKCPYFFARSHVGECCQQHNTQKQKPGKTASLCGLPKSRVLTSHREGCAERKWCGEGPPVLSQTCRWAREPDTKEDRGQNEAALTGGVRSRTVMSVWYLDPEVFPL